ncbi:hypothetical protein T01_5029 [Trichinella spiralis]|uniref:Uncharacterized protein n=1 Tax=Trichinella spiralis TaxID=6334 RepID=A0A0V1AQC9_TRISP|nr:hypothetical protein T01_5029 [Trichinella spiralis]
MKTIHMLLIPQDASSCQIFTNTCHLYTYTPSPMPYNPTQLSEIYKGYHESSTDFHFSIRLIECMTVKIIARIFTSYITHLLKFRVIFTLHAASMKADILHFQTYLD